MHTIRFAVGFACIAVLWSFSCALDRWFPEPPAPDSFYPLVGQVIESHAEGFTSTIIKTEKDLTWLELRLAPHAPGPPPHVHTTFAEHFVVAKGTLSLRVGVEVKVLHAGEHFRVDPGIVHQPFNDTDDEVIVRGPLTPEYALPRDFVLFLSQVYGYIDESPEHSRAPALVLQMSIFSPRYDSWLGTRSLTAQRVQNTLVRPIARALGYRSYYARFVPRATAGEC